MRKALTIFVISISLMGIIILSSCSKKEKTYEPTQAQIIENNLKAVVDSVIANTHVPGVIAGVWAPNEGVDFVYTAGVSDLETKMPLSPDMVFRIGSNTKTVAITVLLQLVDEGLLLLDDKLSKFYPDFPRADEVTIEMITNMRSGIYNYIHADEFNEVFLTDPTHHWTSDELLSIAANHPYYFDPGTSFTYSNTNTILAGSIVEMLTGTSLEYNIRTRIIDQLGLINTVYLVGGTQIPGYHSNGYYIGEYEPELPAAGEYFDISFAKGAGSMVSTVYELKPYVKALAEGTFLSPGLQQQRLVCHDWVPPLFTKYGMGIMEYKGFYGHGGSIPGFTSVMMHSPEKNCTIIVWFNCQISAITPTLMLPIWVKAIYQDI